MQRKNRGAWPSAGVPLISALIVSCGGGGSDGGTGPEAPAPVATIAVSLAAPSIYVGETTQATATLRDAASNVLTGRNVAWSSSDNTVASVSSNGLVTGVAEGSASITATSEGKSGAASVTVSVDATSVPQITNLSLEQNGQPLNTNDVTGTFNFDFDLTLPAGFTGALTVVADDTLELYREDLTAPLGASSGANAAVAVLGQHRVDVNTAHAITVVSAQDITSLPSLRNGAHGIDLSAIPNVSTQPGASQHVDITTNNAPFVTGYFRIRGGTTAQGSDGRTYSAGDIDVYPVVTTYDGDQFSNPAFALTKKQVDYRAGAGTRTDYYTTTSPTLAPFTIPRPAFQLEATDLTLIMTQVDLNGVTIHPQATIYGRNGFTVDAAGSGFANPLAQGQSVTLPPSYGFLDAGIDPNPVFQGVQYQAMGYDTVNVDTQGPQALVRPVFALRDRPLIAGGSAWADAGLRGLTQNYFGPSYQLSAGLDYSRMTDVTGIDVSKTAFYLGPISDRANLYTDPYKVGGAFQPTESLDQFTYTAGARVQDNLGNPATYDLRPSSGSPFTLTGAVSTDYTQDLAGLRYSATKGSLNMSGMNFDFAWNKSTFPADLKWDFNASGSTAGYPDNWLSARSALGGTPTFGAPGALDWTAVLPSTGGTTGTGSVGLQDFADFAQQAVGTRQGLYDIWFSGADRAGEEITVPMTMYHIRGLVDYTPPDLADVSYSGSIVPGTPVTATVNVHDNLALRGLKVGIEFDYPHGGFSTGNAYAMLGTYDIAGDFTVGFQTDWSTQVPGFAPIGFRFFDRFSGAIDAGAGFRSTAALWQVEDQSHNLSAIRRDAFTNNLTVPQATGITQMFATMSQTNLCGSNNCGGPPNLTDMVLEAIVGASSGPSPLSKAEWFGLGSDKNVYLLGKSTTPVATPYGGGQKFTYTFNWDARDWCGPPGPVDFFTIGYTADLLLMLKVTPFFSGNVDVADDLTRNCIRLTF